MLDSGVRRLFRYGGQFGFLQDVVGMFIVLIVTERLRTVRQSYAG